MSRRIQIDPQVVFRRLGDRGILVHLRTNQMFELNETSARFWELLSEGDGDLAEVEARLADEYDVDTEQLRAEIRSTLASFTTERLIDEGGHA